MDERLLAYAMNFGPKLLVAALMLVAGYYVGRWAARMAGHNLERYGLEAPVRQLLENVTRLVVLGLFAIMALQNLGVDLLPLIAGLGVAGAAVALALQGVLGNMAAGLTIIFSKPFRVGDYISIVGVQGVVLDIRLSTTTLGHADLSQVVIPNRKIVGEILHNYGKIRQLAIEVTIAYESDVDAALDAAAAVLRANARVLKDPAPGLGIARLGDLGVTLAICPWVTVADYAAAAGEVHGAILAAFQNRGMLRTGLAYLAPAGARVAVR
jgi:small conductance mechanosensitive channel